MEGLDQSPSNNFFVLKWASYVMVSQVLTLRKYCPVVMLCCTFGGDHSRLTLKRSLASSHIPLPPPSSLIYTPVSALHAPILPPAPTALACASTSVPPLHPHPLLFLLCFVFPFFRVTVLCWLLLTFFPHPYPPIHTCLAFCSIGISGSLSYSRFI